MPKSECQTSGKMVNSHSDFPEFTNPIMTTVSIDADIKAKWPQGHSSYSPGSPEELAIIGIDLLVKELGTEAAQSFIAQVFEKYPTDYKGAEYNERE
ncbi:hypothetical protein D9M70_569930 [compost metagenome]